MSYKRKRADLDDSDEEGPSYGKQILPVANLPEDFNEEPMDGMQYLFMVRRDARLLPGTVRVQNPYEKPEQPSFQELNTDKTAESCLPLSEWRETFEYRFKNFRKNFNQPTIHVATPTASRRLIPDKKDRDLWWAFLSGKPEAEWNPSKKAKQNMKKQQSAAHGMRAWEDHNQDTTDSLPYSSWQQADDEGEVEQVLKVDPAETLPSPAGTPVPLDFLEGLAQPSEGPVASPSKFLEEVYSPREPTPEILKLIDERTALHLLMYFTHWINLHLKTLPDSTHLLTDSHARWIFVLLSRIDDFISADDMHLLRNLARACLSLLQQTKSQTRCTSMPHRSNAVKKMGDSSCWIILTTIIEIWKQRDLWVDAEDMLQKLSLKQVPALNDHVSSLS